MATERKYVPEIRGVLRQHSLEVPLIIRSASGIKINGKRIKSLCFTTDVAIINNMNADGVIAVYPFTPLPSITQAIIDVSNVPVFCGIGGGITSGKRTVNLGRHAEFQGAAGVVVNAPVPNELIYDLKQTIDIPIICTVVSATEGFEYRIQARLDAGVDIFNVSGAAKTAEIVGKIRAEFGERIPIIATGGPDDDTIIKTIDAGANCITYTPPSTGELFSRIMEDYRERL